MRKLLLSATVLVLAVSCSPKPDAPEHGKMDRSRLNIGTYILQPYARTEQHVKDIADCGVDFVVCMQNDRATLDLFSKYGIGAVVTGVLPGWWGGDGERAGMLSSINPMESYKSAAAAWEDHPAAWGIDIGDEPSALDFPYYGRVFEKVDSLFPNQFPYINLYPNYASVSQNNSEQTVNQLGTPTYAEHIAEYVKNVPSDYICYDFYVYSCIVPMMYDNLRIVSDACRANDRSLWIVLQVNSREEDTWISANQLRFQAYTAMAFGAENIIWACWTAGWWHNQVVDGAGQKTQQYDKLKTVNGEIRTLSDAYMKYHTVSTSFIGFDGTEWLENTDINSADALDCGRFSDVCMTDGSAAVAGYMVPRGKGRGEALFVCSADDPYDKECSKHTLRFKTASRKLMVTGTDGPVQVTRDAEGYCNIELDSNSAVLIETK